MPLTLYRLGGSYASGFQNPDGRFDQTVLAGRRRGPNQRPLSERHEFMDLFPGYTIQESHGTGENLFEIISGYVQLSIPTAGGGDCIVAILGPGDYLGFCPDGRYLCQAQTLTLTTLRRIAPPDDTTGATDLLRMNQWLQSQVDGALWHHVALAHLSPLQRLVDFLLWWARRHSEAAVEADAATSGPMSLHIPLRRKDLANHLAMTSETMSRTLTDLRCRGIIAVTSRRSPTIRVNDFSALEALSSRHPRRKRNQGGLRRPRTEATSPDHLASESCISDRSRHPDAPQSAGSG